MKDKFYPSPSNFLKIASTIFEVIFLKDFLAPSLENDAFDLQAGRSGGSVLTNGKRPKTRMFGYLPCQQISDTTAAILFSSLNLVLIS